jgi:predicted DNA-binding protein YlxM (UPF0122 family)
VKETDLSLDEDRAEGLRQALEKLNVAEREVIRLRYEDHETIAEIAEKFQVSADKIRLVHDRAVRKLKKPEAKQLYTEGFVRSLIREEAEKEQKVRSFLDMHCSNEDKETILHMSVYDLGLSAGITNALIRTGINTVEDILLLMAEEPKRLKRIRNLGEKGRHDLLEKLEEYGVRMGDW